MDRRGFLKGAIAAGIGLVTAKLPRSQPTQNVNLDTNGTIAAALQRGDNPILVEPGIYTEALPPPRPYWPMGTLNVKDRTLELAEQTPMSKENAFFIAVMEAAEANVD